MPVHDFSCPSILVVVYLCLSVCIRSQFAPDYPDCVCVLHQSIGIPIVFRLDVNKKDRLLRGRAPIHRRKRLCSPAKSIYGGLGESAAYCVEAALSRS